MPRSFVWHSSPKATERLYASVDHKRVRLLHNWPQILERDMGSKADVLGFLLGGNHTYTDAFQA